MSDKLTTRPGSASVIWPNLRVAWYVATVLTFVNAVSFIDRQILSLLVEPIKSDLNITDTQISLLQGFAFVVFYALMGLPIARIADSRNRKKVIIIGITFWSFMTAACGFARSFGGLFLTRMGVGVGEASLSPSAHSMMSDYFPPDKLAFPMGLFAAGVTTGMGVALIAGAAVIDAINKFGTIALPHIGVLEPWRLTFVIVGLLGVVAVLLVLTIKEPRRIGNYPVSDGESRGDLKEPVPLKMVFGYFRQHWKTYGTIFVGFTMTAAGAYGLASWTPTFYIRNYGMAASDAGYMIGTAIVVGGLFGSIFGGWLSDYLAHKGFEYSKIKVMLVGSIMLLPPGILAPLMPTAELASVGLGVSFFAGSMAAGPAAAIAQSITPNQMRAQASAFYLFMTNLVGLGLGPTVVAVFTDYVFVDPIMIKYSLICAVLVFNPIAVMLIYLSIKPYAATLAELNQHTSILNKGGDNED